MIENIKKILIIGGSQIQLPTILLAKKIGLEVIVVDYNENCVGRVYADNYEKVSTIDFKGCLNVAVKYSIDYVIAPSIDLPVRVMAYVAENLGLPCYLSRKTAEITTNKYLTHKLLINEGIQVPKFQIVKSLLELKKKIKTFKLPVVVKPLDSAGQKIYLINEEKNIETAYQIATSLGTINKKEILIEEYIEGKEYCISGFSIKGKHYFPLITETISDNPEPYIGITEEHIFPSGLKIEEELKLKQLISEALNAIGHSNGPSYTQLFVNNNSIYISEIAVRVGGGQDSKQAKLVFGIDFDELVLRYAMGKKINREEIIADKIINPAVDIRFLKSPKEGRVIDIIGLDKVKKYSGIYEVGLYKKSGDYIELPKYGRDRLGYLISVADTREKAMQITRKTEKLLDFKVK
jgi:biotin carboxylase